MLQVNWALSGKSMTFSTVILLTKTIILRSGHILNVTCGDRGGHFLMSLCLERFSVHCGYHFVFYHMNCFRLCLSNYLNKPKHATEIQYGENAKWPPHYILCLA